MQFLLKRWFHIADKNQSHLFIYIFFIISCYFNRFILLLMWHAAPYNQQIKSIISVPIHQCRYYWTA